MVDWKKNGYVLLHRGDTQGFPGVSNPVEMDCGLRDVSVKWLASYMRDDAGIKSPASVWQRSGSGSEHDSYPGILEMYFSICLI